MAKTSWIKRECREIQNRAIYRVQPLDTNELPEFQLLRTVLQPWW